MEIDAANKVAEGHPVSGQAVVIAGEAGVGKTFLSSAKSSCVGLIVQSAHFN
jgi:chromosomal replication initiation ATPase DnaA